MQIEEKNGSLILKGLEDFDAKKIFECGQAFRFIKEEDGSYTNVAHKKIINVKNEKDGVLIRATTLKEFKDIWWDYFDLDRDYEQIRKKLSPDEILRPALDYGKGIRILNQDPFETIITFIISANNQIPRIQKAVEKIAKMYGSPFKNYDGKTYYTFPDAKTLSRAKAEDLRKDARVGFRDERIVRASEMINSKEVDIDKIRKMTLEDQRKELMRLPGVGPKVADCILLFSFGRSESFPVDVWIKRVVENLYFGEEIPKSKLAAHGRDIFGSYAGFAQQYLFYYGRENKLGK